MNISKLSAAILLVVSIGLGIIVYFQERALKNLSAQLETIAPERNIATKDGDEIRAIRQELDATLSANAGLRVQVRELEAAAVREPNGTDGKPVLAKGLVPADALRNAGRDSPRAAAESLYWAVNGGDTETLASMMLLDEETRLAAEKIHQNLPPDIRAKLTPEGALAFYLGAGFPTVAGMQVLSERTGAGPDNNLPKELSDSTAHKTVHVQVQFGGGDVREHKWVFEKMGEEWRWLVPKTLTDRLVIYSRARARKE